MKTIQWISFLFIAIVATSLARSEEVAREATIVAVEGTVIIGLPGEASGKPAVVGAVIPVGSTIHTGTASQVTVKLFDSTIAIVRADSDATLEKLSVTTDGKDIKKENALINLRVGNIISTLDPAKKSVNNYGIRTPRGIAAARGTIFSVTVSFDNNKNVCTNATISGTVTFYTDKGEISIPFGKFASVGADPSDSHNGQLEHLVDSNPALAAELIAAIKAIADGIKAGTIPNSPGLLAALHKTVTSIDPNAPNPVELPHGENGRILPPLDLTIPITSQAAPAQ